MSVHPTAILDPNSKIGRNVIIGPYVVIGPEVEIGDGSEIQSHAVLEYTTLGKNCKVFPQASLGLPAQHLRYNNEPAKVVVGDNCVFRENVTVHRGTPFDKSLTKIGNNGFFMAYSHVAHDCVLGDNIIMANAAQLAGHVKVGNNCFISASVGIHQFVRIGHGALLSGGAMIPMDVAPFCIAQGDRATLRGLNVIGMRRSGIPKESIRLVKEAYKSVFLSNFSLKEALADPLFKKDDVYLKIFHDFFLEPKRGYTRPNKLSKEVVEDEVTS